MGKVSGVRVASGMRDTDNGLLRTIAIIAPNSFANILEAEQCMRQLALEKAPAASIYNGAHDVAVPLIEIARAASEGAGAGGQLAEWPLGEARQVLGSFADAIACDQVVSGQRAVRELGWHPSRHSIVDELRSYAQPSA
ncbi:hypothetical protein [Sphingomonas sp. PP-F2F-A104-K0414]|uniref:hypothetical protein n=1 Tax=Sphingomonas sp. PP-F2F-A104-K0414 TaxID=2135661 RepID=UPI00104EBFB3|nr:hypothetical protein [Sphingomonas sp. PP-F2F-A104-K0414]